jgi:hypothetical protein
MAAIFSYPDLTLSGTLSGGSWQSSLPLSNLTQQLLSKVARSTNALASSTLIQVNLGSAKAIRCFALLNHNISFAGTVRIRGYSDSSYSSMVTGADTGAVNVWPQSNFTTDDASKYPNSWIGLFSSSKTAQYWKIEITDTSNPNGYVQLGRLWLGDANFEPSVGLNYGSSLGYVPRDLIEESLGGVKWSEKRIPRRSMHATFDALTDEDKYQALILSKTLTTTDEMLFISDAAALPKAMLLESFLATAESLSPLTYPYYGAHQWPIQLLEVV